MISLVLPAGNARGTPSKRLRLALGLPMLALLAACATIGAGSVNRDRLDYAEALTRSWKEQMLPSSRWGIGLVSPRNLASTNRKRMSMKKSLILSLLLIALITLTGCQSSGGREDNLGAAAEIDQQVDVTLQKLYNSTPSARMLAGRAKGILVFPGIVKAGLIGGVQYGKGALREKGRTVGYYNIVAGSYGLQAGVQTFDYALFFMTKGALDYLKSSSGWEVGVGPSVVVVDAGVAKSLTTTTARDDVYAFIFGQQGLMAGMGLQGSKITRVNP